MEVAELVAQKYGGAICLEAAHVLQLWFALFESAVKENYSFRNVKALAASVDYMFHSAMDEKMTKKQFAEKYGIGVSTLTKYCNELIRFRTDRALSIFDELCKNIVYDIVSCSVRGGF